LVRREPFKASDVLLIVTNAFIYFGLSYEVVGQHPSGEAWLGALTVGHAVLHCSVAAWLFRSANVDKVVFYPVVGLVLVFVTIAVPVQLDGHTITAVWSLEAALFFWIARAKKMADYEAVSYALMLLAAVSLRNLWSEAEWSIEYNTTTQALIPFLNGPFFTSLLFTGSTLFILNTYRQHPSMAWWMKSELAKKTSAVWIAALALVGLYFTGKIEIQLYWTKAFAESAIASYPINSDAPSLAYNYDLISFRKLSVLMYGLGLFSVIALVNGRHFKNKLLGQFNAIVLAVLLLAFCIVGLYQLGSLRHSYMKPAAQQMFSTGVMHLLLRYLVFLFAGGALLALRSCLRPPFFRGNWIVPYHYFLHLAVLWVLSAEWLHWTDLLSWPFTEGVSLSILWALYALTLVLFGIVNTTRHLRIGGIALLAVTLLKLFLHDVSNQSALSKTILFISIGVVLLVASFFYNKYTIDRSKDA
jgi:uncharacterized membrane protein